MKMEKSDPKLIGIINIVVLNNFSEKTKQTKCMIKSCSHLKEEDTDRGNNIYCSNIF